MAIYNIFGKTRANLETWFATNFDSTSAAVRARHLFREVYKRGVRSAEALEGINKQVFPSLQDQFSFEVPVAVESYEKSEMDGTVKFVLKLSDGLKIESVLIPERGYLTQCLSTQVGCAQACRFCSTGRMGLLRNLSVEEIVGQVVAVASWLNSSPDALHLQSLGNNIRNIVFMGMGEPLDNLQNLIDAVQVFTDAHAFFLSPNRVTVSTVGLLPELERLLMECPASVALSVHSPFSEERSKLMPVNIGNPIGDVFALLRKQNAPRAPWKKRTFFIQYTLIRNVNDSTEHAEALANLLTDLDAKVNIIPLNEHEGTAMRRPDLGRVYAFQQMLKQKGFVATVRISKGRDIAAACGQLIKKKEKRTHDSCSV